MALGDIPDFVGRLRRALPTRWFPDNAPVLTGLLTGFAAVWAALYDLLQFVKLQTRISTATGVNLDIIATDFFHGRIVRTLSESDTHFRRRILLEILRPRATRAAVDQALFDLTGVHPTIFEPALASDTGGYNIGGVGYNLAGGYGSLILPFQAFITAFRPAGGGIANVSGYGNIASGIQATSGQGGYNQGAIEWASREMISGAITDDDIYATVAAAMPAATIAWTRGLAASSNQIAQVLRPASAFSRSVSTATAALTLVAGRLMAGSGFASSTSVSGLSRSVGVMMASGFSKAAGQLVTQSGILIARGRAAAAGLNLPLGGSGLFSARGVGRGAGKLAAFAGTLGLIARGSALASGFLSALNSAGLSGRTLDKGAGVGVATLVTALVSRGRGLSKGVAVAALVGGASLVVRGRAKASGKLGLPTTTAALFARSISKANGRSIITTLAAAPTAPVVTPSDATPGTITLTWPPSQGA